MKTPDYCCAGKLLLGHLGLALSLQLCLRAESKTKNTSVLHPMRHGGRKARGKGDQAGGERESEGEEGEGRGEDGIRDFRIYALVHMHMHTSC